MKNYKLNDELIREVIYNGCRTAFVLTSKYCENKELVQDEPLLDGYDVKTLPQTGRDYLIADALKDSKCFKKGGTYAFRITYLNGKNFTLTQASDKERNAIEEIMIAEYKRYR